MRVNAMAKESEIKRGGLVREARGPFRGRYDADGAEEGKEKSGDKTVWEVDRISKSGGESLGVWGGVFGGY